MTLIGPADQYWRLRLVRVDDGDELDLEWRDDVLYRSERAKEAPDTSVWHVEAVRLDDESTCVVGSYDRESDAREAQRRALEDLIELTVSEFSQRYGCPA